VALVEPDERVCLKRYSLAAPSESWVACAGSAVVSVVSAASVEAASVDGGVPESAEASGAAVCAMSGYTVSFSSYDLKSR